MRMWHRLLTPYLCDKHLLGAHGELHKHRPSFVKKYSVSGRVELVVQIEPARMGRYHEELAREMVRRGMNHRSPYEAPDLSYLPRRHRLAKVSLKENIKTLKLRCIQCALKIKKLKLKG